jgi:hypothetical protein
MPARIYAVIPKNGGPTRLVRAIHRAGALSHVAATSYEVRVAEQDDIVDAMTAGGKVEPAGAEVETEAAADVPPADDAQLALPIPPAAAAVREAT